VRIGIDVGGTKLEGIAMDSAGHVRARRRVAAPRGSYQETLQAIAVLVAAIEDEAGAQGSVGIGIPGAVSPATGLVKNANSTWLNGRPFSEDMSAKLARPIRVANDANCFALSEATDGAAAGAAVVFGVILGTGTGGGLVVNGHVLVGPNAIAGEWGHNPLPWPRADEWPGEPCYCGRTGCIESFLSGPALARDFARAGGEPIDAPVIVARAASGDPQAAACVDRYADRLARALASVINIVDPDVIVLGGGLSNAELLYATVSSRWGAHVFSDSVTTRLVRARHGDASGVRGAAWLWPGRTYG
jgi:fructokinase